MRWDITVQPVDVGADREREREFIVGEQTMEQVIQALEAGVDANDGHEVGRGGN